MILAQTPYRGKMFRWFRYFHVMICFSNRCRNHVSPAPRAVGKAPRVPISTVLDNWKRIPM